MNIDAYNRTEEQLTACPVPGADPQLELALAEGLAAQLVASRPRRQSRASWWFQRMRQIVDRACDWQPLLVPRPEQIWFPNTHRTISLAAQSKDALGDSIAGPGGKMPPFTAGRMPATT